LRTIGTEGDKGLDEATIEQAREAIERAKFIHILGYGFDPESSRRLNLGSLLFHDPTRSDKRILFTNFGDSNRVNKEASMIFFHNRRNIYSGSELVCAAEGGEIHIERSIKDVCGAFSFDFDAPEQVE
jgi:hypothetical protein